MIFNKDLSLKAVVQKDPIHNQCNARTIVLRKHLHQSCWVTKDASWILIDILFDSRLYEDVFSKNNLCALRRTE
jgi:hypothetical protein